jgi:transcriptional regulator with XRE-family HTH domain
MTGKDLQEGRTQKGWTQDEAARRLGVSQPYLSLLEKGSRRVPVKLAHKASTLFELSPTRLPMKTNWHSVEEEENAALASDLAALGYPGFAYLKSSRKRNPAEVLLSALSTKELEPRLTEALPWVLMRYVDLDWEWLAAPPKSMTFKTSLGF